MLWMVTVGLASTRRTTMITVISSSSVFHRSSAAVPVRAPVSDVANVTSGADHRDGSDDQRPAAGQRRCAQREQQDHGEQEDLQLGGQLLAAERGEQVGPDEDQQKQAVPAATS